MISPELSPRFRESLAELPSFYQLKDRQDREPKEMDESNVVLPITIDELADLTTQWGCPLVGLVGKQGVYEIERNAWYPYENDVKILETPKNIRRRFSASLLQ